MNKTCTKCGREFPHTPEFFYAAKEIKSGLRGSCKDCDRLRHKRYAAAHPDKVKAWKAADIARRREAVRAYHAAYYAKNIETELVKRAEYREAHREEARARDRAYYESNRDKFRVLNNQRRMRERASGSHSVSDIRNQVKRQRGRCYWCGKSTGDDYHVDHVIPIARGGSNGPDNLVIACPPCNQSKGAKLPHEFADRLC